MFLFILLYWMFLKGENYRNQVYTHLMGLNISLIYGLLHNLLLSPRFISSYWEPSVPRTTQRANAHRHRSTTEKTAEVYGIPWFLNMTFENEDFWVWTPCVDITAWEKVCWNTDTFSLGEGKAGGSNLADNSERVSQGTVTEKVRPSWSNGRSGPSACRGQSTLSAGKALLELMDPLFFPRYPEKFQGHNWPLAPSRKHEHQSGIKNYREKIHQEEREKNTKILPVSLRNSKTSSQKGKNKSAYVRALNVWVHKWQFGKLQIKDCLQMWSRK